MQIATRLTVQILVHYWRIVLHIFAKIAMMEHMQVKARSDSVLADSKVEKLEQLAQMLLEEHVLTAT